MSCDDGRMNSEELANRFTYHPPRDDTIRSAHEQVRVKGAALAAWLNQLLPECREKSQALTAVDDTVMYANAAIARQQNVDSDLVTRGEGR